MEELVRVPPEVRERFAVRFGAQVAEWCDELPALVGGLAGRWGLEVAAAGGGGTSRVFRCMRGGAVVWLKLTPEPAIAREEAEALGHWAATPSVVPLLAADLAAGALLLGDVPPGTPVRRLGWELPEVAVLLAQLRVPVVPGAGSVLRPLADRVGFVFDLAERRGRPLPAAQRAAALELAATGPVGLVHGDLHPSNVLAGPGGRLVAIDPRPTWGDPDFDAVDWVLADDPGPGVVRERVAELAALVPGLSPDRLHAWCRALRGL
ncbi:aminoglycoside phosphotransferase family protein [Kitasatospora sp. NPDC057198]|uniref:aminoglycoside phosphotransferase family protein n=1 Tax=Kitasatospora sp. NPDC057198 TaxID=3346046 RepID=UPI0036433290